MKNLLLVLTLFLFTLSCAQEVKNVSSPEIIVVEEVKPQGVWVDTRLQDLLTEYITEAKVRGIDVVPQLLTMDYIGFSDAVRYPVLGVATKDQKIVSLGYFCMLDETILKVVLFHELTHSIFAVGHSECSEFDIMKATSPKSFRIYEDKGFWKLRLDELFEGKTLVLK